jgi:hypothetical protein
MLNCPVQGFGSIVLTLLAACMVPGCDRAADPARRALRGEVIWEGTGLDQHFAKLGGEEKECWVVRVRFTNTSETRRIQWPATASADDEHGNFYVGSAICGATGSGDFIPPGASVDVDYFLEQPLPISHAMTLMLSDLHERRQDWIKLPFHHE